MKKLKELGAVGWTAILCQAEAAADACNKTCQDQF